MQASALAAWQHKQSKHINNVLKPSRQLLLNMSLGMCGKPKFGLDSVLKNQTVQKI